MQMSRQTQTNVLVLWITTYHTQPDAQIIPTSKQICPSRLCSSLILFSLLPRLFMQTVLFCPHSYPAHIVRWRPVQCSNRTRGDLKGVFQFKLNETNVQLIFCNNKGN